MIVTRRQFLKVGAAAAGGLLVEVWSPVRARAAGAGAGATFAPSAVLRVAKEGVTFVCPRAEMGQGIETGLAMLVAEELEIAPAAMTVVAAPADRAYDNAKFRVQLTGGSTSVIAEWEPMRLAGAVAREMLVAAAARRWGVAPGACEARDGAVTGPGAKRATYGELAEDAARSEVPKRPRLRQEGFRVIGKPLRRVDARPKVDGSGVYGIDVRVPDRLVASVVRCPVPGGKVKAFDPAPARAVPGVVDVVQIPSGVAVLARDTWTSRRGADRLAVTWDEGPAAGLDSDALLARYQAATAQEGKGVRSEGDAAKALAGAGRRVEATYVAPFLAHATMEPQNATALVTTDRCEVWAPTQGPGLAKEVACEVTGLSADRVTVHNTLIGGGFGRRIGTDFVAEAVWCARAVRGRPVQVVWSREDDLRHDIYRPLAVHAMRGALGADGAPIAWAHTVVTQSIMEEAVGDIVAATLPSWVPTGVKRGAARIAAWFMARSDESAYEGADTVPYAIPNLSVRFVRQEPGVPAGFWRSVGHSHTAFAVESFVDELAHAAGQDPWAYRRGLLAAKPRHQAVLDRVAEQAGWGRPLPAGRFRGIAQHAAFESFAAVVAEVEVKGGAIAVRRVVVGLDCGRIVNPNLVSAQLEGAVVFALSAALKGRITWKTGRVEQSNFGDFDLVRMDECPVVETVLVPGDGPPTGVGEPGVPPVAPAVANAVFAATGKRLRTMPLSLGG